MKITIGIFAAALFAAVTIAQLAVTEAEIAQAKIDCGDLGVMSMEDLKDVDLPEDFDVSQVRTCRDHPLGNWETPEGPGESWFRRLWSVFESRRKHVN
jgi:hypothetical protein